METPVEPGSKRKNLVAGTWSVQSAFADLDGRKIPLFGAEPSGLLVFTEDMHFTVILNDPAAPHFADADRTKGTAEENKSAVASSLALYGTYSVDSEGRFTGERVIGSTFANWNGLSRTTSTLTETVTGDTMIEHLQDPGGPAIELVWKRVR